MDARGAPWRVGLFGVRVGGIGRQDDEPSIDRKGASLDTEFGSFLVREGRADLGPALTGLAVNYGMVVGVKSSHT
jgi:hypothetical protein